MKVLIRLSVLPVKEEDSGETNEEETAEPSDGQPSGTEKAQR